MRHSDSGQGVVVIREPFVRAMIIAEGRVAITKRVHSPAAVYLFIFAGLDLSLDSYPDPPAIDLGPSGSAAECHAEAIFALDTAGDENSVCNAADGSAKIGDDQPYGSVRSAWGAGQGPRGR